MARSNQMSVRSYLARIERRLSLNKHSASALHPHQASDSSVSSFPWPKQFVKLALHKHWKSREAAWEACCDTKEPSNYQILFNPGPTSSESSRLRSAQISPGGSISESFRRRYLIDCDTDIFLRSPRARATCSPDGPYARPCGHYFETYGIVPSATQRSSLKCFTVHGSFNEICT